MAPAWLQRPLHINLSKYDNKRRARLLQYSGPGTTESIAVNRNNTHPWHRRPQVDTTKLSRYRQVHVLINKRITLGLRTDLLIVSMETKPIAERLRF